MPRQTKLQSSPKTLPWLPALALFVLTAVTYIPSMTNGFIWDDPQYVVDNPQLKTVDGLWRIWTDTAATPQYYPMVHSTFWIEAHLWGTHNAMGFHIDNILLHALAALLLWQALVILDIPAAFLAAAIFAVHPVMVESVTWVTERKNVLSIVFYLLAFLAYGRSGLIDRLPAKRWWYTGAILFFLFALLSKTVTCSLPAAILLIIWWKRGGLSWKDVEPLLPMLVFGLVLSSITSHLEQSQVGAKGPDFQWSPVDRCLIAGHAVCFYAFKIIWPHPLIFMYPRWDLHTDRAVQFIYPSIVILVVATLWFTRKKIGRGPLVAVLFLIGTLVPALGFVNVYPMRYSFVADHFQYLASIGLIVLIAAAFYRLSRFSVVVCLPLAWITWHQQYIYKDAKTLWENTIAQNPTCWMAHINLATELRGENHPDAAAVQIACALQLAPNEADPHYEYGRNLAWQSKWPQAISQFRQAIQCDPDREQIWGLLSAALWDHSGTPQGQAQAVDDARHALSLKDVGEAHYVLARFAELRGDLPAAIDEYKKALLDDDENYLWHQNLGNCLLETGHPGEAAGEYQRVLGHDRKNAVAWTNLGYAYLSAGRAPTEAARCFQNALALDPNLKLARQGLSRTQH
jgi:tetratricopeptide (TPR) repeat protein